MEPLTKANTIMARKPVKVTLSGLTVAHTTENSSKTIYKVTVSTNFGHVSILKTFASLLRSNEFLLFKKGVIKAQNHAILILSLLKDWTYFDVFCKSF